MMMESLTKKDSLFSTSAFSWETVFPDLRETEIPAFFCGYEQTGV